MRSAPLGTFAVTGLLRTGLQNAAGRWSSADLLPTALHLIAEVAARAIDSRLPLEPGVDEVIVTGAGQRNDLLMRAFAERLTPRAIVRLPELGLAEHARNGAIAGALALLHLDQTPACPTAISGARHAPRAGSADARFAASLAAATARAGHKRPERALAAQRTFKKL